MEKTLLVGNGLNRTLEAGISWNELMARLGSNEPEGSGIPFPLEFERIAASRGCLMGKRNIDSYKELKEKIVELISPMDSQSNDVLESFRRLPFDHVVTTNYDQAFEHSFRDLEFVAGKVGSTRNVLIPVYRSGSVDFYHAHGIDRWKNTLCLGHEHYASLIGKIRNSFYPSNDDGFDYLDKLVSGKIDSKGIWPEYLLTNDVAIVGFGLDYCESDFWWLLALRASLFAPCREFDRYANTITYYSVAIEDKGLDVRESCKMKALESFGVKVERTTDKTYKDAYKKIAGALSESWSK